MAILEGAWDCSQCNTQGIRGGLIICPRCGDPRNPNLDPEESPYLPDNARVITDSDELEIANAGPNWNCGHCGHANIGTADTCSNCNQPISSDDSVAGVYTYVSGVYAEGTELSDPGSLESDWVDAVLQGADPLQEVADGPVTMPERTFSASSLPNSGEDVRWDTPSSQDDTASNSPWHWLRGLRPSVLIASAVAVLLLVASAIGIPFVYNEYFAVHSTPLTVQNLTWERQVEVEAYRTLTYDDWSVPADGRVLSSHQDIHHYNQVLDHYERRSRQVPETVHSGTRTEQYACGTRTVNRGNGYYDQQTTYCSRTVPTYTTRYRTEYYREPVYKQVPIYQTKYTYEVDRWVTERFEVARGESDERGVEPLWPSLTLTDAKLRIGDERREHYEVELADTSNRHFTRQLDLATWLRLSEGETVTGQQTKRGDLRGVEWPAE